MIDDSQSDDDGVWGGEAKLWRPISSVSFICGCRSGLLARTVILGTKGSDAYFFTSVNYARIFFAGPFSSLPIWPGNVRFFFFSRALTPSCLLA